MADQPAALPPVEGRPPPSEPAEPSTVYASRPPTTGESKLVEKFHERLADQSKQMDELARQMITIELAVPGLYAAILALIHGDKATLPAGWPTALAFGCWFAALLLTFVALFPRDYRVNTSILRADPAAAESGVMGVEDFFRRAAEYKKRWLLMAALAFWAGIAAAVLVLFQT